MEPLQNPRYTLIHTPNWGKLLALSCIQTSSIIQIHLHYPNSLLIIREVSTNSHNMFKDACVRERTPEAYGCLFKGCVFKRRPHKTVPQSLEVLKWISPMSEAKFISSIINQSKLPELCNQLLWMPLFAQSPSAESVRYRKIVTPSKPM